MACAAAARRERPMFGIHAYGLFLIAGILLNLTPGQDTMFIIGRSLTGGSRAGVAAALGIAVGSVCHTLAAALGLSAVLATSALAFAIVKLVGAAYLIYLGAKLLLASVVQQRAGSAPTAASSAPRAAFLQGILTNVLNPKVALFFLAFLPQFIAPASETKIAAFLALGATFITTGLIWCLVLAIAAVRLQQFLLRNPSARTLLDRAVGAVFLALGVRLAWSR
jgi:threonine/homoserine/homoserine lactone efflux protein